MRRAIPTSKALDKLTTSGFSARSQSINSSNSRACLPSSPRSMDRVIRPKSAGRVFAAAPDAHFSSVGEASA